MAVKVYPYRQGSQSAKLLADTLGGRVLRLEGSRYRYRPGDLVINWGNGTTPQGMPVLNVGAAVTMAANKLLTFRTLQRHGVAIPRFWERQEDIPHQCLPVVCRTVLNGHSGRGIVIANTPFDLVDAPLYTQYVRKEREYRIHVFRDDVVMIQRKIARPGQEPTNWQVRNLDNGFIFQMEEDAPPDVLIEAVKAVEALGLDFGGVDVVWHRETGAKVLEVNTACGLEERTAQAYAEIFNQL